MIVEATITIMVSDVDKALAFYTEVLGLKLKKRYSEKYAEVEVGDFVLGLHIINAANTDVSIPNNLSVGFRVEDLEAVVAKLRGKGLTFSSSIEEGKGGWFINFQDPDSNPLYLWQRKTNR
jgi:predicted enzyme related to lactoylglutathione lyase